jgi:hypothetical protein
MSRTGQPVEATANVGPGEEMQQFSMHAFGSVFVEVAVELALVGIAPVIANAVFHATGKRIRELPITPDKLL